MESPLLTDPPRPADLSRAGARTLTGLFLAFLAILVLSPAHQYSDSAYSLLVSESLLRHGTPTLDEYVEVPLDRAVHPGTVDGELPYQLLRSRGHVYYVYPPGTSILSVPYVALSHLFGMSAVDSEGRYDYREERRMQFRLAALLMACLAVVTFLTARCLLSSRWSLLLTVGVVLTTQVWSTASRGLWSHTWAILLVSIAIYHLVRNEVHQTRLRPALLATVLTWAYFSRPTMVVAVAVAAGVLAYRNRRAFTVYAATVGIWMTLFVATSWWQFGRLLPPYYRPSKLGTPDFWEGLAGNLVSPSRGILIFLPHLLIIGYWLIRYARRSRAWPLGVGATVACLSHLLIVAGSSMWWGGHGYGPRLMTDAVPWLALLSLIAFHSWLHASINGRRRRIEATVAIGLTLAALIIHAGGALPTKTEDWNWTPVNVDEQPSRVWDWRDAQFLSPYKKNAPPTETDEGG